MTPGPAGTGVVCAPVRSRRQPSCPANLVANLAEASFSAGEAKPFLGVAQTLKTPPGHVFTGKEAAQKPRARRWQGKVEKGKKN